MIWRCGGGAGGRAPYRWSNRDRCGYWVCGVGRGTSLIPLWEGLCPSQNFRVFDIENACFCRLLCAKFIFFFMTKSCQNTYRMHGGWRMGGCRRGAQGARAPSKPMAGRSGLIDSILLALPVRFQNALKHAWNRTKLCNVCDAQKFISGWCCAQTPLGELPKPHSRVRSGYTLPSHLPLKAFGVSLRRLRRLKFNVPLPKQFSGTAPGLTVDMW